MSMAASLKIPDDEARVQGVKEAAFCFFYSDI